MLVGYQAQGSLGRRLMEGTKRVKIMGEEISVRAKIHNLEGFSAHADQNHLIEWLAHLKPIPAHVFIVHGEPKSQETIATLINQQLGISTYIPRYGDSAVINGRELRVEGQYHHSS